MTSVVTKAWRGVAWYLKQLSGEFRWDDYLAACERDDVTPTTRREFERHRADRVEHAPMARCC
jgi:uncharacterized short protein YbdD (DUF466 family)